MKPISEHSEKIREEIRKKREENEGVSLSEACEIMGISRSTLYRFLEDGIINKVQQGKSPKILLTEIQRYIDS
ncbi:helix-turn-helix domain-containing protein [Flavobacterium sp. LS2P90]|uniref:Helix-turn-helix domain-containing protein n=1 Tax=Flavobacterium xylosi TaxID=3230415 RepID=A0ABW6HS81_9FLAO